MNNVACIGKWLLKATWIIVKFSLLVLMDFQRESWKKTAPRYTAWYATELYEADEISMEELHECTHVDH